MARGTTVSCKLAGNADGLDRLAEYFGGVGALLVSSMLSVALYGHNRVTVGGSTVPRAASSRTTPTA